MQVNGHNRGEISRVSGVVPVLSPTTFNVYTLKVVGDMYLRSASYQIQMIWATAGCSVSPAYSSTPNHVTRISKKLSDNIGMLSIYLAVTRAPTKLNHQKQVLSSTSKLQN